MRCTAFLAGWPGDGGNRPKSLLHPFCFFLGVPKWGNLRYDFHADHSPTSGSFGAYVAIAAAPSADWKSPSETEKRPQPLESPPLRGLLSLSGSVGAYVAIAAAPSADWKSPSETEKRPQPLESQPLRGLLSLRQGFPIPEHNGCGLVKRPTRLRNRRREALSRSKLAGWRTLPGPQFSTRLAVDLWNDCVQACV
jgi:hypothetical protein